MLTCVFRKIICIEHTTTSVLGLTTLHKSRGILIRESGSKVRPMSTDFKGQEQQVTIDSKNINYLKVGTGNRTVLCLPGALGSIWSDFTPQIQGLDKDKFTVVVWDPPGYGHSRPPERDFSPGYFQRDADLAFKLMKSLDLPKFSCLGWSDGGITALIMGGSRPQDIEKLVVWGANSYVAQTDLDIYYNIKDLSKWSVNMKTPLIKLYGEERLSEMWSELCDAFQHMSNEGGDICKGYLPKITAPTFVLHGAKDPMVPNYHPPVLLELIKNVKYHEFKDGKHNIHIKYSQEFNTLVTDFLLS